MDAERRRERIGESDVFFILESISSERAEIDAFTTRRIERTSPRLLPRKLELEYRKRAFDRRLRISPTILRGRGEGGEISREVKVTIEKTERHGYVDKSRNCLTGNGSNENIVPVLNISSADILAVRPSWEEENTPGMKPRQLVTTISLAVFRNFSEIRCQRIYRFIRRIQGTSSPLSRINLSSSSVSRIHIYIHIYF